LTASIKKSDDSDDGSALPVELAPGFQFSGAAAAPTAPAAISDGPR